MKTALSSLSLFALVGFGFAGCDYGTKNDIVNEPCAQMGFTYNSSGEITGNRYEFQAIGLGGDPALRPTGTFEVNDDGDVYHVGEGNMIVDDDDLLDDYEQWQEALRMARELLAQDPAAVEVYKNIEPGKDEGDFTDEETDANAFVLDEVVAPLLPLCGRLNENPATGVAPRPGDDLNDPNWPPFAACKDHFAASGDGVVGHFELLRDGHQDQDAVLATCPSVDGGANNYAMNFWGPLTTKEAAFDRLPADVRDGFTYSGLTIPLESSAWKQSIDRSDWDGIAFWARNASAGEAVDIQPTPGAGQEPYSGRELPTDARPQDGVSSLGIIVQTIDTAAVLNLRGEMDFMDPISVCVDGGPEFCFETQADFDEFPGQLIEDSDPPAKWAYRDENDQPSTPEMPPCVDYSPVDTAPGDEVQYRDQCWDGFRTMVEIGTEWRFFFIPFNEMRQAGWGRVADSFRIDQIRSINLLTSAFQPINVMVDEVSLYRKAGTGPEEEDSAADADADEMME